jgi:hypothetical protein
MVMIDAQTVRGGRAGPTFHDAGSRGGRTIGAERSILIEYLGLPLAVRVDPARPHDVTEGRACSRSGSTSCPSCATSSPTGATAGSRRLRLAGSSGSLSRPRPRASRASCPWHRSTRSSTPSRAWAAGDGSRAATRTPRQAAAPGSRCPASRPVRAAASDSDLTVSGHRVASGARAATQRRQRGRAPRPRPDLAPRQEGRRCERSRGLKRLPIDAARSGPVRLRPGSTGRGGAWRPWR